jgi:phage terminase large subunit GpA-like protein
MSEYFQKLPQLRYNNIDARDITRRVNFLKKSVENPFVFLPYIVEGDMRPEDVAYHYYGSANYAWIVYLANNIIDPYHQWPLSQENFDNYLIRKYETQSGKKGYEVVDWTQNETIDENILYYYKEVD